MSDRPDEIDIRATIRVLDAADLDRLRHMAVNAESDDARFVARCLADCGLGLSQVVTLLKAIGAAGRIRVTDGRSLIDRDPPAENEERRFRP